MKVQCLYYALDKWLLEGGYIAFRKSEHWCMPHVLHIDANLRVTHYIPPDKLRYPWYSAFGFSGYVREGESYSPPPMPAICMLFGTILLLILGGVWLSRRLLARVGIRW